MLPNYLLTIILVGSIVFAPLFTGCRTSGKQPVEAPTKNWKKLIDVMNTSTSKTDAPAVLSTELGKLTSEYQQLTGDSLTIIDPLFKIQFDSTVLRLSSKLFMQTDPQKIVLELNACIFETWGISFIGDRNNAKYLFPHHVLECKQGSCIGMSLLYLLLAEKLGIPIYGVLAPGHFFIRFDNGNVQINIETLRKGECMSATWYRKKYMIDDTLRYSMRNLTVTETIAVVNYNLGTIFLHKKKYNQAAAYLKWATSQLGNFPEAWGNYALALDALGDPQRALALLTQIKKKYPAFENIDNNIASLLLKRGKYEDALASYTELSLKQPENAQFHYGRGVAFYRLKKNDEAIDELKAAISLAADFKEANELLTLLKKQ
jgi:tetratricopeptide (TPR) repeat protein